MYWKTTIIKNWQRNSSQKARFGGQWGEMLTSYRCGYSRRSCGKRLRWRNVKILPEKSKECEPQGWHFTSGCWSIRNTCSHIEISTVWFCKNTEKIVGDTKERLHLNWFPNVLYDWLQYLEMCDVHNIDNFYYYSKFHKGNDWQWCWQ